MKVLDVFVSELPPDADEVERLRIRINAKEPIAGEPLDVGSQLITVLGAANRDPRVYDDPDAFDVTRPGPSPLSFSAGIHFCLGAALARMEMASLFTELVRRLDSIELAGTPELSATTFVGGLKHLPIRYSFK